MLELAMLLSLELGSGDNQNKPQQKHYSRQHKYFMNVVRECVCARAFAEYSAVNIRNTKTKTLTFLAFFVHLNESCFARFHTEIFT